MIQQAQTSEREVLHTTLPCRQLTMMPDTNTSEVLPKCSVPATGRQYLDIHIYSQSAKKLVWSHVTSTVATRQGSNCVLRPNSARFFNTPTILGYMVTTQMQELQASRPLSISRYHDHKLTLSKACTKYSIHPALAVIPSFSRSQVNLWM